MVLPEPWEVVIGLEVHVQLKTRTKLFSDCPVSGGSSADLLPNTFTDPISLGLPGTLPTPNAEAIRLATRLGLALGCEVAPLSWMARKHYFYADLPKGYQISQHHHPICRGGAVPVSPGVEVALTRIHLEEDAGKTVHDARRGESQVDLNRAGVALVEIVSEPVMHSADEAVAYLKALHQLVIWLGISDGDMEAGNFRCDANVSLRRKGEALGTRTEIKNVNSFRFVGLAIHAEIQRQFSLLSQGLPVIQETRGWDETKGVTRSLRSKEDAHDYRFFPEPDLCPIAVSDDLFAQERTTLPELPLTRSQRFQSDWGLASTEALSLTDSRERADYFEAVLSYLNEPKLIASWLLNEVLGTLAKLNLTLSNDVLAPDTLAKLLTYLKAGKLSGRLAKEGLQVVLRGEDLDDWVVRHGGQVSDSAQLTAIASSLIEQFPNQVAEYLSGKEKLFGFFVGQAMKLTQGKANPEELNRILRALLEARR